jgi:hypothetical protein
MPPSLARILLVAALAGPAAAGELTFYGQEEFRGMALPSDRTIPNFADIGFNDRAASIVIRSGSWQLCSDAYFRGRCVTLGPGQYPSLAGVGLAYVISSAREVPTLPAPAPVQNRVVLYEGDGFSGRSVDIAGTIDNFQPLGFNDRARSMAVLDGEWELCVDAHFRGYCQVFGRGQYASIGVLAGQVSSIRPVDVAVGMGLAPAPPPGPAPGWGRGARAILYEGQGFAGRTFVIGSEVVANLDGTGFNDRAASLRVEAGYWVFCSDAQFGGECRTFGPGDYPTLPWGLAHRISSGRRIHGTYPYEATPNWAPQPEPQQYEPSQRQQ